MIIRAARYVVSLVATAIIIVIIASCAASPPSTDAGPDPSIDCCDYFILPLYFDTPQVCLDEHTDVDELQDHQCRWLSCLDGLRHYEACNCGGELHDGRCP